jgi:hypothetical protein
MEKSTASNAVVIIATTTIKLSMCRQAKCQSIAQENPTPLCPSKPPLAHMAGMGVGAITLL